MSPHPALTAATRLAGWSAAAALTSSLLAAARARPVGPEDVMPVPPPDLPAGRLVAVPEVGELFIRDTAPDAPYLDPTATPPPTPTIVLLHGWMFPSDLNWFTCYAPLAGLGRVIAVDHRGHGRGLRPSAPFRLHRSADDVAALLAHLGTGPVVVVGFSMGGPITQLLWQRHPEAVRALVLCATSDTFNVTARDRWTWRLMGTLQLLLRLVPRHWWERLISAQVAGGPIRVSRMVNRDTPPEVTALLPWIVSELDRDSAEDVAEAGRELGRYDARGWIGSVDVPTGVLVTADDSLVPPENQRGMARRIPGAQVREVPLDHDGVVAHPDRFVPALTALVRDVLERSGEGPGAGRGGQGAVPDGAAAPDGPAAPDGAGAVTVTSRAAG